MKREIKFRAKSLDGVWKVGELRLRCKLPNIHTLYGAEICINGSTIGQFTGLRYIDENTIGQFTGMRDKNGKEIYEGDIIRHHLRVRLVREKEYQTGIVEFEGGSFIAKLNSSTLYFCGKSEDYEVIGNIYDNPELLEGGAE